MNLLLLSLNPGAVPGFLDQCIGELSRRLRLGYISDAGEGMSFASVERASIESLGYDLVEVHARDSGRAAFADFLDSVDAVYVAGGETFALLEALRSNGTGELLAARVRAGLPYIGCSAGSISAGPSITPAELMDDRDKGPGLLSDEGLSLIDEVVIPHADGRLPHYPRGLIERIVSEYGDRFPLLMLGDDQAMRVSSRGSEIIASP